MLEIFIANFILASTFTFSKALLVYLPPLYLAGFRCLSTGIINLMINAQGTIKKMHTWLPITMALLLSVSFSGIFMVYFLEFWALQSVTTTKVALLYNLFPFFMVIFSFFFFGERMNVKKWLGLIIGIGGIIPILMAPAPGEESVVSGLRLSWQELALMLAMVFESFSWVCSRFLVRDYQFSVFLLNGVSLVLGGLALIIFALFVEQWPTMQLGFHFFVLFACLVMVAVVSNNWITNLFKKFSLSLLSLGGLLLPVFTALLGYIFLGEMITKETLLSFVIIAVGMYIFYQEELKQGY